LRDAERGITAVLQDIDYPTYGPWEVGHAVTYKKLTPTFYSWGVDHSNPNTSRAWTLTQDYDNPRWAFIKYTTQSIGPNREEMASNFVVKYPFSSI